MRVNVKFGVNLAEQYCVKLMNRAHQSVRRRPLVKNLWEVAEKVNQRVNRVLTHGEGLCFLSGYLSVPITGFLSLHTKWPDHNISYESLRSGWSARGKKGWNFGSWYNDFNRYLKIPEHSVWWILATHRRSLPPACSAGSSCCQACHEVAPT